MTKGLFTELRRGPETTTSTIEVATGTQLEHGEKTWSTGQLARDLLQNHLDAHSEIFFNELIQAVAKPLPPDHTEQAVAARTALGTILWRYKKYLEPTDAAAARAWLAEQLQSVWRSHSGLKSMVEPGCIKLLRGLDVDAVVERLSGITERRPDISYKVADTHKVPPQTVWLSYDDIQSEPYADTDRFTLVAWKIQDQGNGFDAKLQSLYKSTKTMPYERGRFGEGMKMSHLHALRHGASVKVRSGYLVNDGTYHLWQSHPLIASDNSLHVRGVEITQPQLQSKPTGSATLLEFSQADVDFVQALRGEIDPRIGGLAKNCIELSPNQYHYYGGYPEVGISTTATPDTKAVQGLHIPGEDSYFEKTVFAYDLLDQTVLGGRDRRHVERLARKKIEEFWEQALPAQLVTECVRRLVDQSTTGRIIEESALETTLHSVPYTKPEQLKRDKITGQIVDATMQVLGLQNKKRYLLVNRDVVPEGLLASAASLGVEVKLLARTPSTDFIEGLNKAIKARGIILYTRLSFHTDALKDTTSTEGNLATEQKEIKAELDEVVAQGRGRVEQTMRGLGLNSKDINIQRRVKYTVTNFDPKESCLVMHWDERKKTFVLMGQITSTAETVEQQRSQIKRLRQELIDQVQVYCVAAVDKFSPYQTKLTMFEAAQAKIERWHTNSLLLRHPDVAQLPKDFDHTISAEAAMEINPYIKAEREHDSNLTAWEQLRVVRSQTTPLDRVADIYNQADRLAEPYRSLLLKEVPHRLAFDGDQFAYIRTDQASATAERRTMAELEQAETLPRVCGQLEDGRPVVQLNRIEACFPITIPDGAVVTIDNLTVVYFRNQFYRFVGGDNTDSQIITPYESNDNDRVIIQPTAVTVRYLFMEDELDDSLAIVQHLADTITIQAPDQGGIATVADLPTECKTDLPKEYGTDAWNDPVRLVQDIIQNHIDAAGPTGILLEFEVVRRGHRQWVPVDTITKTDTVVGLRIADSGNGYTPHNIHRLGSSSKVSPLFRGKYGEGQKMVAAAAARHDFDLEYSSVVKFNGRRTRWTAKTGTTPESVVVKGKPTTVDRVTFAVRHQPESTSQHTSTTTLRLPETRANTGEAQKIWQAIVEVAHPRNSDALGRHGMARYVRALQPRSDREIDLGYMTILLDEPGVVYENGLRIATDCKTTVGYDLPSITKTRERSAVDSYRLAQYINSALVYCHDVRYIEVLADKFFSETWNQLQNRSYHNVRLLDQRWDMPYDSKTLLSRPLWDAVLSRHKKMMFVHSVEFFQNNADRATTEDEFVDAQTALHTGERLPKHLGISVDAYSYQALARFMPTSSELGQAMRGYEIAMSSVTEQKIRAVIAVQAELMQQQLKSQGNEAAADSLNAWRTPSTDQATEVILSPLNALTLGSIKHTDGPPIMAINEKLLATGQGAVLVSTTQHELTHHATGRPDFDPGFLNGLLNAIDANLGRSSWLGKSVRLGQNLAREE